MSLNTEKFLYTNINQTFELKFEESEYRAQSNTHLKV